MLTFLAWRVHSHSLPHDGTKSVPHYFGRLQQMEFPLFPSIPPSHGRSLFLSSMDLFFFFSQSEFTEREKLLVLVSGKGEGSFSFLDSGRGGERERPRGNVTFSLSLRATAREIYVWTEGKEEREEKWRFTEKTGEKNLFFCSSLRKTPCSNKSPLPLSGRFHHELRLIQVYVHNNFPFSLGEKEGEMAKNHCPENNTFLLKFMLRESYLGSSVRSHNLPRNSSSS